MTLTLISLCPFPLSLVAAPGTPGSLTVPSSGRAVAISGDPETYADLLVGAPTLFDEAGEPRGSRVPLCGFAPVVRVEGLPATVPALTAGVIVPLAVAAAMRSLGMCVPYRVYTPQMLTGQAPNQYAPGLVFHPDLTAG